MGHRGVAAARMAATCTAAVRTTNAVVTGALPRTFLYCTSAYEFTIPAFADSRIVTTTLPVQCLCVDDTE